MLESHYIYLNGATRNSDRYAIKILKRISDFYKETKIQVLGIEPADFVDAYRGRLSSL